MWGNNVVSFKKYYINVPFSEKDRAKALGARWDAMAKKWYYTNPDDEEKFSAWAEKKFMSLSELTDEQQGFIQKVKEGSNILVDACIGSGKTTAIQVLCNEMPDKKILYLTYNTLLKIDAREKIRMNNVTVTNYHGFAYQCLKKAGIYCGQSDLIQSFLANKPALGRKYDMIVLDEYQDIEQEIAEMLDYIKQKCEGIQIVAVGDMMQKIYDKTTLNVPMYVKEYLGNYDLLSFTKCFRLNADLASRLGKIWGKDIVGVNDNCKVETMNVFNVAEFLSKQNPSDILCLGARTGDMARVLNILEKDYKDKFNKQTVYASISDEDRTAVQPSSSTAIFTTFDSSKGLERKICVVFDYTEDYWFTRANMPFTKYEILRNIFCVAASRGKERIIFVTSHKTSPLSDETLATPVVKELTDIKPFLISEMFSFKYKEDVEKCYKAIEVKDITEEGVQKIDVNNADCLIDLSPCIGIWQECDFFDNYDIDEQLEYTFAKHDDRPVPFIKKDATVDDKILALTAFTTCYSRYTSQVKAPFIEDEKKHLILNRLATVFDGKEVVQQDCSMSFLGGSFEGRYDVMKDGVIYELKFKHELAHEDFLQLASYLVATGTEKGIIWNVATGKKYEVTIPAKRKFLNAVVRCITKGEITRYLKAGNGLTA